MRFVIFILLCFFSLSEINAQSRRRVSKQELENALQKKIEEAVRNGEAAEKKVSDEKKATEVRHNRVKDHQERKYNSSMQNINQYSTDDFMNNPQKQSGFSTKVNSFRNGQQSSKVVATRKDIMNPSNTASTRRMSQSYNSNVSSNGVSYIKDQNILYTIYNRRYNINGRSIFPTQKRVPPQELKSKYPSKNKSYSELRGANKPGRIMFVPNSSGQNNTKNMGQGQMQPSLAQQKNVQNTKEEYTQKQQEQPAKNAIAVMNNKDMVFNEPKIPQEPTKRKVAWTKNGKIVLDPSQGPIYINTGQDWTSTDLRAVDTKNIHPVGYPIGYGGKDNNTPNNNGTTIPNQANHPSDLNNKGENTQFAPPQYEGDYLQGRNSKMSLNEYRKISGEKGKSNTELKILLDKGMYKWANNPNDNKIIQEVAEYVDVETVSLPSRVVRQPRQANTSNNSNKPLNNNSSNKQTKGKQKNNKNQNKK